MTESTGARRALPRRYPAAAVVLATASLAMPAQAQRSVDGNRIVSSELPAATIDVDADMVYVGVSEFPLYGVADVELHLFVEHEGRRVKRLLWVQFEGYRDDNDYTYDYSNDPVVRRDGIAFHTGERYYPSSDLPGRANSDGDHVVRLLREHGYELGRDVARVRMVWLLNEPARDELMLIYIEDLADHGTSVAELDADAAAWARFAEGLRERAFGSFTVERR